MSRDSMFNARFGSLSSSIGSYPLRTAAGMYEQEQELAKADEAGLIVTAADLNPYTYLDKCDVCGKDIEGDIVCTGKYTYVHPECDIE